VPPASKLRLKIPVEGSVVGSGWDEKMSSLKTRFPEHVMKEIAELTLSTVS
jgi:hypothetical protein